MTARSVLKAAGLLGPIRLTPVLTPTARGERLRSELVECGRVHAATSAGLPARLRALTASRRVLVAGAEQVAGAVAQFPLLTAFRAAGYRPVVLLGHRDLILQHTYRRLGCETFTYLEDILGSGPHPQAERIARAIASPAELLNVEWLGTRAGKFALSTLMRFTRQGDPDLNGAGTRDALVRFLSAALHAAEAADRLCDQLRPDACLLNERGYTPFGQLLDAVLSRGGYVVTWNAAHRNNAFMLKRYHSGNLDQNHFSLSVATWERMLAMPWNERHWQIVSNEIQSCYRAGEWFSECGTQVEKIFPPTEELRRRLGLRKGRKVAAIFPHMFWDATFFWGIDVFRNYEDWFGEALKCAVANRQLDWIVKIHPANITKNSRDNFAGEQSEIAAIRRIVGSLPDHIKLIEADSELSTLSLIGLVDVCLTVRGTIGIEAACAGARVITAGTGRYDRLGFTIDPSTPDEYRELLARIHELAPPTPEQIELARRFAYGIFVARPLSLESISFEYGNSPGAPLHTALRKGCGVDPFNSRDIGLLVDWYESGEEDFLDTSTLGESLCFA